MLPQWDPNRLTRKIPFVLGLVGGRRQGKSTAVADLLSRMSGQFDLVLCMVGSASCNPVLEGLLQEFWDDRFFFPEWDNEMMAKLLEQQELIQRYGQKREVLILIDDVVLSSQAEDQLAHMCMRGRHFSVSVCMCAVSYTSLPKRARRSLDTLLVFSCPMKGDLQILTWELSESEHGPLRSEHSSRLSVSRSGDPGEETNIVRLDGGPDWDGPNTGKCRVTGTREIWNRTFSRDSRGTSTTFPSNEYDFT